MLSREENELITHIGPGTLMGNFMRQFWVPALLASEVQPDGDPVRVLLLGEQLVAFRDSNGVVGLIANACPHRGASLWFGRNEECGLRCVYHGWKFDTAGRCVDMPNEPAESNFKHKITATAYPCRERGGLVWAYLGPRAVPPPLPDIEGNMLPDSTANAFSQLGNWLQVLEGDLDTIHAGFLHYGSMRVEDQPKGTFSEYQLRDRTARFAIMDTEAGCTYGAYRDADAGMDYWRIAQYWLPFWATTPPGVLGLKVMAHARVPMDDEHTMSFTVIPRRPGGGSAARTPAPHKTGWHTRLSMEAQPENDFFLDRALQRRNEGPNGYTGIPGGVLPQDGAITTSMGTIADRRAEHLGTTDVAIIRVRRRLLDAARAFERDGTLPSAVDHPETYRHRAGGVLLPKGADWVAATQELRQGFVDHPELDPAINGPL